MTTEAGAQESKEGRWITRFMCLKGGPASREEVAMTEGVVRTGGNPYEEGGS
jgi:hypothetical protein